MKLPFARSYWVEPGQLLAGFYPGGKQLEETDRKLHALLDCGVSHILNLMEANEVDHAGQPFEPYELRFAEVARQRGKSVRCRRLAIVDRSIPSVADMNVILEELATALARRETVYVHCWGGRGRTGTVIGCYLRQTEHLSGFEALAALARLTEHNRPAFWPAPEMAIQRAFIEEWRNQP